MKVIIAGGRYFKPKKHHEDLLRALHKEYNFTEIFSGGAKGADEFGEKFASENEIPVRKFPAKWAELGNRAGPIRNWEMAREADAVILFSGGKGTASMRHHAMTREVEFLYDEDLRVSKKKS